MTAPDPTPEVALGALLADARLKLARVGDDFARCAQSMVPEGNPGVTADAMYALGLSLSEAGQAWGAYWSAQAQRG